MRPHHRSPSVSTGNMARGYVHRTHSSRSSRCTRATSMSSGGGAQTRFIVVMSRRPQMIRSQQNFSVSFNKVHKARKFAHKVAQVQLRLQLLAVCVFYGGGCCCVVCACVCAQVRFLATTRCQFCVAIFEMPLDEWPNEEDLPISIFSHSSKY